MANIKDEKEQNKVLNTSKEKPNGVSDELWNAHKEEFKASDNVSSWDDKTNNAFSNLNNITSKQQIISDSALKGMSSQFQTPSAVTQADAWLSQQLQTIQSGKTSYSDDVRNMIDKIMNREEFSYDVDKDPLFQQALASATNSGKQAMQDTIGQASALTGGYGSSYATSAGNQAYNSFIEDAYDNLPQYYQMALEAYQMEGEEMYRQYGMLSEQDDKEYNRNLQAYDATYQHRNRIYDEAYQLHRDGVNDSFALANLQLNEHGQRVSDAYNLFNASSAQADKMYEREYTTWVDKINMLYKDMEMLNTDWWNQTNFDEGVRQYEKSFAEDVRQFDENQAFQAEWNQKQMDFQAIEAEKDRAFTASENAKNRAASASKSGGSGGSDKLKEPTQQMMKDGLEAYNKGGKQGLTKFLASIPESYDETIIANYATGYGESWAEEYAKYDSFYLSKNTKNGKEGGFLGIGAKPGYDHDDEYTDRDGRVLTFDELKDEIESSTVLTATQKEDLIKKYHNQGK